MEDKENILAILIKTTVLISMLNYIYFLMFQN